MDPKVLPIVAALKRGTFDDIALRFAEEPTVLSQLPKWLNSAEWRRLITCSKATRPQTYQLGPEAPQELTA